MSFLDDAFDNERERRRRRRRRRPLAHLTAQQRAAVLRARARTRRRDSRGRFLPRS